MNWLFALLCTVLAMLPRTAFSNEIQHPVFPSAIVGTWGETTEKCKAKDGSHLRSAMDRNDGRWWRYNKLCGALTVHQCKGRN